VSSAGGAWTGRAGLHTPYFQHGSVMRRRVVAMAIGALESEGRAGGARAAKAGLGRRSEVGSCMGWACLERVATDQGPPSQRVHYGTLGQGGTA
jgi:hypothetical protein